MTAIAILLALFVGLGVLVVFVYNEISWLPQYLSAIVLPLDLLSDLPSVFLVVPVVLVSLLGIAIVVALVRDLL